MNLDQDQQAAVELALGGQNCAITGGAGTGKTTIIKTIVQRMRPSTVDVLAPTGKAAALLRERTGYDAQTIHRWLKFDGTEIRRKWEPRCNAVIVDESSMVDSWLLAAVLKFRPRQIVLVGDAAQLPPVGRGAPFHDMLRLFPERVATLLTCHRARGAIHEAARMIRAGTVPWGRMESDGEVWDQRDTGGPEQTQALLLRWIEAGAFRPEHDIILTCRNGEGVLPGSVDALNDAVLQLVNGPRGPDKWKECDRVMNLKNNYEDDWYNGDTGIVDSVDTKGQVYVSTDRAPNPILLDKEGMRNLTHAYAATVHKAQGSQYERVFVLLFRRDLHMLNRNLIYTAVTRAQRGVVVMGEASALRAGLAVVAEKRTVIQCLEEERLENEVPV